MSHFSLGTSALSAGFFPKEEFYSGDSRAGALRPARPPAAFQFHGAGLWEPIALLSWRFLFCSKSSFVIST